MSPASNSFDRDAFSDTEPPPPRECPVCGGAVGRDSSCTSCGRASVRVANIQNGDELVGKYRIERELGRGAMGVVYRAIHREFEIPVAVKVMTHELAAQRAMRVRFADEARALARVRHPNVVRVLDFGESTQGDLYLVMELVVGKPLTTMLREEAPLPIARGLTLAGEMLSGLAEVHASGLVHRDVKPDNVMITRTRNGQEGVKLLDFGLARRASAEVGSGGFAVGTPEYMSPEQAVGEAVDARSDVYAVAAILYELLAGERLYPDCTDRRSVLRAQIERPPTGLAKLASALPADLLAIIMRGLAKMPSERYASASDFADALLELRPLVTAPGSGPPAVAAPSSVRPRAGVPREEPLAAILASRPAGAIVVVGDAASGKTALARAFAEHTRSAARRALVVEAASATFPTPLSVARDLVVAALGTEDLASARRACESEPELDRLGLRVILDSPGTKAVPYLVRRREAVAAFVALMHRRDADVVVDDAHSLDAASRILLRALMHRPGPCRILVTSRAPFEGLDTTVRLSPRRNTLLGLGPEGAGAHPGGSTESVAAKLAVLSPQALEILEVLAVSGRPMSARTLGELVDQPPIGLFGVELVRFVRPGERDELRLHSPSLRSAVDRQMSPDRRRALHGMLSKAALDVGDDVTAAAHALAAGNAGNDESADPRAVEDLVELLLRAGEHLRIWFDDENARRAFRAALEIARRLSVSSERASDARASAAEGLARLARYDGDHLYAEELLREAVGAARTVRTLLSARRARMMLANDWGLYERAVHEAQSAQALALQLGETNDILRSYEDLADAIFRTGKARDAETPLQEAVTFARQATAGSPENAARLLSPLYLRLARLAAHGNRRLVAGRRLRELMTTYGRVPKPSAAAWLIEAAELAAKVAPDRARTICLDARAAAKALGDRQGIARALRLHASLAHAASDRHAALHEAEELEATLITVPKGLSAPPTEVESEGS